MHKVAAAERKGPIAADNNSGGAAAGERKGPIAASGGREATRRGFYGIAEIADALGLNRQLVTAWRRRRSHGIPEPDAELSSGPIWRGATVEPWIDEIRQRRGDPAAEPIDPDDALRACRRVLRLTVLLLEEPIRTRPLSQALAEVRALLPILETSADDALGRAVHDLLAPMHTTDDLTDLRTQLLAALPHVASVVRLLQDSDRNH